MSTCEGTSRSPDWHVTTRIVGVLGQRFLQYGNRCRRSGGIAGGWARVSSLFQTAVEEKCKVRLWNCDFKMPFWRQSLSDQVAHVYRIYHPKKSEAAPLSLNEVTATPREITTRHHVYLCHAPTML